MEDQRKIIDLNWFSENDNSAGDEHEDWEDDYYFLNRGDYEGLKKLREAMAKNNPQDIYMQWRLGEAYILCKEYEKAIDFLEPIYRANPDFGDVEYSILDALFALGKSERDFKWVSVPVVLRLEKETSDICYDYLKGKRKAKTLDDVYCSLLNEGYLAFNEEELLNDLIQDGRFTVQREECVQSSMLGVKPKTTRR